MSVDARTGRSTIEVAAETTSDGVTALAGAAAQRRTEFDAMGRQGRFGYSNRSLWSWIPRVRTWLRSSTGRRRSCVWTWR